MKKTAMALLVALTAQTATADLTLYTDRPTARLTPVAQKFQALTGEKVIIVEAGYPALIAKLTAEGSQTPADSLMTKDLVNLIEASQKNLFQPMATTRETSRVIPAMRDPQNLWIGLTFRARTAAFDPSRVNASDINNYADLADAKWAGRLCLRSSSGGYSEALGAYLISTYGAEKAKEILMGFIANLATTVFPNDTALLEAIATGVCDVGIVNSYYLAGIVAQKPNFPVKIQFLEQSKGGVHTNGSGMGILKTSQKLALAQKFIELLLTEEVQLQISSGHLDYPVIQGLIPNTFIKDWGTFKTDSTPWSQIGTFVPQARQIFSEIGYK
ncbi:MAG: extracellular solute-binding protein [Bdellovibrio sp.]